MSLFEKSKNINYYISKVDELLESFGNEVIRGKDILNTYIRKHKDGLLEDIFFIQKYFILLVLEKINENKIISDNKKYLKKTRINGYIIDKADEFKSESDRKDVLKNSIIVSKRYLMDNKEEIQEKLFEKELKSFKKKSFEVIVNNRKGIDNEVLNYLTDNGRYKIEKQIIDLFNKNKKTLNFFDIVYEMFQKQYFFPIVDSIIIKHRNEILSGNKDNKLIEFETFYRNFDDKLKSNENIFYLNHYVLLNILSDGSLKRYNATKKNMSEYPYYKEALKLFNSNYFERINKKDIQELNIKIDKHLKALRFSTYQEDNKELDFYNVIEETRILGISNGVKSEETIVVDKNKIEEILISDDGVHRIYLFENNDDSEFILEKLKNKIISQKINTLRKNLLKNKNLLDKLLFDNENHLKFDQYDNDYLNFIEEIIKTNKEQLTKKDLEKQEMEIIKLSKKNIKKTIINLIEEEKKEIKKGVKTVCQHDIEWKNISDLETEDPSLFTTKLYEFYDKYIDTNEDNIYICNVCGTVLSEIENYVIDMENTESGITILKSLSIGDLKNIKGYDNFPNLIDAIDRLIERISGTLKLNRYTGNDLENINNRKDLTKDIIDLLLRINSKGFESRERMRNVTFERRKKYNISNLSDFFYFRLNDNVFKLDSESTDKFRKKKVNNIIGLISVLIILEITKADIKNFDKTKILNLKNFNRFKKRPFENVKIKINNDEINYVNNYEILMFVLYYMSHMIVNKYQVWEINEEDERPLDLKKRLFYQVKFIHTVLDIIASLTELSQSESLHKNLLFYYKIENVYDETFRDEIFSEIETKKEKVDEYVNLKESDTLKRFTSNGDYDYQNLKLIKQKMIHFNNTILYKIKTKFPVYKDLNLKIQNQVNNILNNRKPFSERYRIKNHKKLTIQYVESLNNSKEITLEKYDSFISQQLFTVNKYKNSKSDINDLFKKIKKIFPKGISEINLTENYYLSQYDINGKKSENEIIFKNISYNQELKETLINHNNNKYVVNEMNFVSEKYSEITGITKIKNPFYVKKIKSIQNCLIDDSYTVDYYNYIMSNMNIYSYTQHKKTVFLNFDRITRSVNKQFIIRYMIDSILSFIDKINKESLKDFMIKLSEICNNVYNNIRSYNDNLILLSTFLDIDKKSLFDIKVKRNIKELKDGYFDPEEEVYDLFDNLAIGDENTDEENYFPFDLD